jgi:hypothetical protein
MVSRQQNQQYNKPAFVLGNGISRLAAKLDILKTYGTVYGCNALYREFDPDHLIAVDAKMVKEIIESGYHSTHSVWTNPNRGVTDIPNINYFKPHRGWSSGPTALHLASQQGHKEIYILGFDYQGLHGKVNNVYAGTFNYKTPEQPATFFGNWSAQTERIVSEFKSVNYYRVEGDEKFTPKNLDKSLNNFFTISYSDLEKKFENCTYFNQMSQKTII